MARAAFLADDLTGATDVLDQAHACGLDAVLVLRPDRGLPDAEVVGVATPARSLGGAAFDAVVRDGLTTLRDLAPPVLLYKVCSTFDSSPRRGSIGRGIELLRETFPGHGPVPVIPAQPGFGRYTAFGQHFGRHDGQVHRLDRHPVMSRHPATPMTEADLRLVLAEQFVSGAVPGTIELPSYQDDSFDERWRRARSGAAEAFVVDAVTDAQLDRVAERLTTDPAAPALVVGSGGVMAALARRWGPGGTGTSPTPASGPVAVVSASASVATAAQIADAVDRGWQQIPIPVDALTDERAFDRVAATMAERLAAGHHTVAHTVLGPDDPRLRAGAALTAERLGGALGRLLADLAGRGLSRDLVVCGGDTASHALIAAGVTRLRVAASFVTAGPVCRADDDSPLADCRVLLKGGQVGPVDVLHRFVGP